MNTAAIIGLIFIGGGAGSIARYSIGEAALQFYKGNFPLATLLVNLLACLILGTIIYVLNDKLTQFEWVKYLALIGFCGGFSTFSTFSMETLKLFQDQWYLLGILNVLISLGLGVGILLILTK